MWLYINILEFIKYLYKRNWDFIIILIFYYFNTFSYISIKIQIFKILFFIEITFNPDAKLSLIFCITFKYNLE